jgi:hypothetical protein
MYFFLLIGWSLPTYVSSNLYFTCTSFLLLFFKFFIITVFWSHTSMLSNWCLFSYHWGDQGLDGKTKWRMIYEIEWLKSGYMYKRSVYERVEKSGEHFMIRWLVENVSEWFFILWKLFSFTSIVSLTILICMQFHPVNHNSASETHFC